MGTLDRYGIGEDEVRLWGSGRPRRELLYVDDLAEACLMLMERYDSAETGEIVNVGTGTDISIHDLAALVSERIGYEGAFVFDGTNPDGTPRKLLDVARIRAMGWRHRTGLAEGIDETYRWYLETVGGQPPAGSRANEEER